VNVPDGDACRPKVAAAGTRDCSLCL